MKKRRGLVENLRDIDNQCERIYKSEHLKFNKVDDPSGVCISSILTSSPSAKVVPTPSGVPIQWPVSPIKTKDVNVTVKVKWPSKNRERKLPVDLESLGKMLVRGMYRQIANAASKNPSINKHLRELMVRELEKEVTQLCSKKKSSCLRNTNKQSMVSFTMEKVSNELEERTPLLYSVLSAVSINRRSKAAKEKSHFGAIAMAAAVCLKNRCKHDCCATSDYNFYLSFQLDGMLCYVMLCYVMLCYVMLCYVMLCYVMLCYVMLCYVMLCYVMLCYVVM